MPLLSLIGELWLWLTVNSRSGQHSKRPDHPVGPSPGCSPYLRVNLLERNKYTAIYKEISKDNELTTKQ